ncbi:hypothetical protein O0L34_g6229 [Tuta absoluta]|nr:hypothetical protein O0L34_g6229 [Tuta absoluta]
MLRSYNDCTVRPSKTQTSPTFFVHSPHLVNTFSLRPTISRTLLLKGLRINSGKTKDMLLKTSDVAPIFVDGEAVEQVQRFTYLWSVVDPLGGADVEARID